jgi:hypothetical protein
MDVEKVGSGIVLASLVVSVVVIAATTVGLTMNQQLLGSDLQIAAAATAALFFGSLVLFAAFGRPWKDWSRTPYW